MEHFGATLPIDCLFTVIVVASAVPLSNRRLTGYVGKEGARVSVTKEEPTIGCLRFGVPLLQDFVKAAKAREALMRGEVEPKPNRIAQHAQEENSSSDDADHNEDGAKKKPQQQKSHTFADILDSIQSAVDARACTFAITGYESHPQYLYRCSSCSDELICEV